MAGFDQEPIFTSGPRDEDEHMDTDGQTTTIDAQANRKAFKEFLRLYQEGNYYYKYRYF
jgi:hypothetical protein